MISGSKKYSLALSIVRSIKEEFKNKHLSGNLENSISINVENGKVTIEIDAQIYNMYKFFKEGSIIHTGNGSYASFLDEVGSEFMVYSRRTHGKNKRFLVKPHNHIGYVENNIYKGVLEWADKEGISHFRMR